MTPSSREWRSAEVLGEEHVARAQAETTALDADFQRFITETAWGTVWSRPGLDRRSRHLITLAMLATLGRHDELALYVRATCGPASPKTN